MFRIPHIARMTLAVAVALGALANAAVAARHQEPFSSGVAPAASVAHAKAVPTHTDAGLPHVVVNIAWAGTLDGTHVTVGASTYTFGTDAFAAIQAGVDAIAPGGTVDVLPGTYMETAPGSFLYNGAGPYQFGVFLGTAKPGVTLQGVTAAGAPITSAAGVATTINYAATNSFGSSGIFVEGDHVTIRGLGIGVQTISYTNKTIEVIGEDFTLRNCVIGDDGGSVYLDDFRATMTTSWVQSYHVLDNVFVDGNTVDVASGPGISGPVSGRVISGNQFTMSYDWNSISFSGTTPAVGWYLYPVGGALISGNAFVNTNAAGTIIKARGTYDNTQFDWASYWNGNTFNRATCEGVAPPANLRAYAYNVFTNARRIEATVQGEVDNAASGDMVLLHAGTYTEQVVVNGKSVTLQGDGRATTSIVSPATLATSVTTASHVLKPVVAVTGAADVELQNLTVNGNGAGNANYEFAGVVFWNAGGKLLHCDVKGVRETPFNGDQHGLAIYASNNTGGPYAIEVGDCTATDYQKNGITLNGAGLTVNVHDCTVTGQGQTGLNAENGIQLSGSSGAVTNCTVSGNYYTGGSVVATGMLLFGPSTVNVSGCSLSGNQYSVYSEDASGALANSGITAAAALTGYPPYAVELYNDAAGAGANSARRATGASAHVPPPVQAFVDDAVSTKARPGGALASSMTFAITGGCMTGPGVAGTAGVAVYSEGGPLSVTMTGAELSGWDAGFGTGGAGGVSVIADHNRIAGNLSAGYEADGPGASSDVATLNWWGNAGGPGAGGANPVVGTGVVSSPWLTTGADANPGCGFTAGADNVVAAGPAPSCLSQANTCILIPVTIARTTSDNVRGYSITIQLSSNIDLCSGTSSVTQGTYLSSVGGTHFEVMSNGSGSYTIDCALLGLPCGATAPAGTLFNLAVHRTGTGSPGTVSVASVVMRDCDNAPVAATAGSPLAITIDTSSPTAMSNLTAAQVKTGNDGDGTTKILLTFTAPTDADSVIVYRAGFGHYPEYDDAGGAVPAIPSYPPVAPWARTSVTASGQTDEPSARDFWYYVAFSKDACGNLSAVSNRTGGTLNYHLGDVVDPYVPASIGDNKVDGADISRLGFHYGITLALNDPFNYLDVGPTTNYSVNARPTTDNKVGFEDLMMFAINYGLVSAPQAVAQRAPASHNALSFGVPAIPGIGETFAVAVHVQGTGDVQGASVRLTWDPAKVEPVGVEAGELLQGQRAASVVLSPEPGTVDFALLGTGMGIAGDGDAARVLFRVKAAGDPAIGLGSLVARDTQNQPASFDRLPSTDGSPLPATTEMSAAYPNPFGHSAALRLSLARAGAVKVAIYDLAGRRVRMLMDSAQPAGNRILTWDGRSDAGLRMAAGVYVVRFEAGGITQSRRLQFLP